MEYQKTGFSTQSKGLNIFKVWSLKFASFIYLVIIRQLTVGSEWKFNPDCFWLCYAGSIGEHKKYKVSPKYPS